KRQAGARRRLLKQHEQRPAPQAVLVQLGVSLDPHGRLQDGGDVLGRHLMQRKHVIHTSHLDKDESRARLSAGPGESPTDDMSNYTSPWELYARAAERPKARRRRESYDAEAPPSPS